MYVNTGVKNEIKKDKKLFYNPNLYFYDYFRKKLNIKHSDLSEKIDTMETILNEMHNDMYTQMETSLNEIRTDMHKQQELLHSFEVRDPYAYDDVRRYIQQDVSRKGAQFILEHMQKDNIPFPYRDPMDLLGYAYSLRAGDGLNLEFGVFQGKTINYLANQDELAKVYGFDSFQGLPETWRPGFEMGCFRTNEIPGVQPNVDLVPGLFEDTLGEFIAAHNMPCSFIHIDCDLYSSAKFVLQSLKNNIMSGTIIVFDEFYNYPGYEPEEYRAFFEFIKNSFMV